MVYGVKLSTRYPRQLKKTCLFIDKVSFTTGESSCIAAQNRVVLLFMDHGHGNH
jgi:hypothetical protein